jgi:hypothetical protein
MDFGPIETRERLTAAAAGELEIMLESLFEHPVRIPNTGMASVPVIGGQSLAFFAGDRPGIVREGEIPPGGA